METKTTKKPNYRFIGIFAITLSVLSITFLGIIFYMTSRPKTILLQSANHFVSRIYSAMEGSDNSLSNKIATENNTKIANNLSLTYYGAETKETFNFKTNYHVAKKEKQASLNSSLIKNEETMLELKTMFKDSKAYWQVMDIMNNYYYSDFDFSLLETSKISDKDLKKVFKLLKETFIDKVDSKKITKKSDKIKLDTKTKKVTRLDYKVTEKMLVEVIKDTYSKIKDDDKLLSSIAKTSNMTTSEYDEVVSSLFAKLDGYAYKNDSFTYSVYYYGFNNIIMEEIKSGNYSVQLLKYNDTKEYKISELNKNIFTLKITKKDKENLVNGNISNYKFEGKYTTKDSINHLSLKILNTKPVYIDIKIKEVEENNQYIKTLTSKIGYDESFKDQLFTIDVTTNYSFNDKVTLADTSNSKDIKLLLEEDFEEVITNIEKHPLLSQVYSLFSSLSQFNNYLDETNYDNLDDYDNLNSIDYDNYY